MHGIPVTPGDRACVGYALTMFEEHLERLQQSLGALTHLFYRAQFTLDERRRPIPVSPHESDRSVHDLGPAGTGSHGRPGSERGYCASSTRMTFPLQMVHDPTLVTDDSIVHAVVKDVPSHPPRPPPCPWRGQTGACLAQRATASKSASRSASAERAFSESVGRSAINRRACSKSPERPKVSAARTCPPARYQVVKLPFS